MFLSRWITNNLGCEIEPQLHKWVIAQLSQIERGKSILDAGAGQRRYRGYCSHLIYKSQDFCQYTGSGYIKEGIHAIDWDTTGIDIVSNITSIPVADCSFDTVLCTEVLEHVPDPITALQELVRILKINGKLIITVPFISFTHMAPYHYCTGFNKFFFLQHLPAMGMNIDQIVMNGSYQSILSQELRRVYSGWQGWRLPIGIAILFLINRLASKTEINGVNDGLATGKIQISATKTTKAPKSI